jgi:hypothetical protein
MSTKAPDKLPPGPELDALTAQRVFGWKNVHKHDGALVGKKQDKAGHWRSAKVPHYSTPSCGRKVVAKSLEYNAATLPGATPPPTL